MMLALKFTPPTIKRPARPFIQEVALTDNHAQTLESQWLSPEEFYLQAEENDDFEQYQFL